MTDEQMERVLETIRTVGVMQADRVIAEMDKKVAKLQNYVIAVAFAAVVVSHFWQ